LSATIDDAKKVLVRLSQLPEFLSAEPTCDIVSDHKVPHRWLISLKVADESGRILCSSHPNLDESRNIDFALLTKELQGRDFALSGISVNHKTGVLMVTAAAPIFKGTRIDRILLLHFSSPIIREMIGQGPVAPDVGMFLVDKQGMLIAHHPPVSIPSGAYAGGHTTVQKALGLAKDDEELLDLAGVPRLFVFRTLPHSDAIFALGVNRSSTLEAIDKIRHLRLMLITITIWGSVILGAVGLELLILYPLRNVVGTAEALERGDFTVRAKDSGAGEVRVLGRVLNRMAGAIAERKKLG
jgi:hypothetical protein